jgi:ubiquitin-protein ligase
MGWTSLQQTRLKTEQGILTTYFPAFEWKNPTDSSKTTIEGNLKTNSGNIYRLRVYVPSDYPNSRPEMVVLSPHPLTGFGGVNLNSSAPSGAMHILSPRDGYVSICHYKDWLPNLTLYLVILKSRLWLEALEGHKQTGRPIDHFLSHMS